MRLDAPVFVRLAPPRGFTGDLADSLVALSAPEPGRDASQRAHTWRLPEARTWASRRGGACFLSNAKSAMLHCSESPFRPGILMSH